MLFADFRENDIGAAGKGALIDVAERLSQRNQPPTVVVIPDSRSRANDVLTAEQARQVFDATHALQLTLRREGSVVLASGAVIELSTMTRLEELSARYTMAQAGDLSMALRGTVSKALHLQDTPDDALSTAARAPYYEGLFYLRRDQHSYDSAIPLFRKAASVDPRSPLPRAGMAESLVLQYRTRRSHGCSTKRTLPSNACSQSIRFRTSFCGTLARPGAALRQAVQNYRRVTDSSAQRGMWLLIAQASMQAPQGSNLELSKCDCTRPGNSRRMELVYFLDKVSTSRGGPFASVSMRPVPRGLYNLGATLRLGRTPRRRRRCRVLENQGVRAALNSLGRSARIRSAIPAREPQAALTLDSRTYLLTHPDSTGGKTLADADAYYQRAWISPRRAAEHPRNGRTRASSLTFWPAGVTVAVSRRSSRRCNSLRTAAVFFVQCLSLLGRRDRALQIAGVHSLSVLELDRHPDLSDFRQILASSLR